MQGIRRSNALEAGEARPANEVPYAIVPERHTEKVAFHVLLAPAPAPATATATAPAATPASVCFFIFSFAAVVRRLSEEGCEGSRAKCCVLVCRIKHCNGDQSRVLEGEAGACGGCVRSSPARPSRMHTCTNTIRDSVCWFNLFAYIQLTSLRLR